MLVGVVVGSGVGVLVGVSVGVVVGSGVGVSVGVVVGSGVEVSVTDGVGVILNVGVGVGVTNTHEFQYPLLVKYVDASFAFANGAGGPPTKVLAKSKKDCSVKNSDLLNPKQANTPGTGVGLSQPGTG